MDAPETLPVKVKITGDQAGLRKISGDFLGLAGDLAEPMLILAAGGSKVQAAWSGIRGVIENRVLGPIGMVAGVSAAALIGIVKLAKGFASLGMAAAANLQSVETRFKAVLRSQTLAAERIRMNVDLAKETPYSQDEVMEANRALQVLSQGALATKENMIMIGDATATAGEEFSTVAKWTGRLYDALQSGAPIGEASMRLQEMGVITGQTRRTLESMSESGASFSEMWGVVENQLKKSQGAMKDLSANLEGLQSTYADTMTVMSAKFSAGFLEGEAASIEATTKLMAALTPAVETLGDSFGVGSNLIARFKASIVEAVAGIPGLSAIISSLTLGVTGLLAVMAGSGLAAVVSFASGLLEKASAAKEAAEGITTLTLTEGVQIAMTEALAMAQSELALALKAVVAGEYAAAGASLKLAAVHLWTAVKTNAASMATVIYRVTLATLGATMRFVGNAAKSMVASLAASPFLLVAMAVAVLIGVLIAVKTHYDGLREKAEAFKKVTDDLVESLRAQQRAIATGTDLMRAQNAAINELTAAKKALLDANREGTKEEIALAEARVAAMAKEVAATNNFDRAKLAMTDDQKAQRRKSIEDPENVAKAKREEARGKMSSYDLADDLQKEADEARDKLDAAKRERDAQKAVEAKQFDAASSKSGDSSELASEEARLQQLQEVRDKALRNAEISKRAGRGSNLGDTGNGEFDPKFFDNVEKYTARMDAAEKEITAKIKKLRDSVTEGQAGLDAALSGDSKIKKLQAQKSLREQANQAGEAVKTSPGAAKDATKEQKAELELLKREWQALLDLADKYNVALDSRARDNDDQDLEIETERLQKAEDALEVEAKAAAARKAADDADIQARGQVMDYEKAILGLKDLGIEGDLKAIEIEKEKLQLAKERQGMTNIEYDTKNAILDAEAEALKLAAKKKALDVTTDSRVGQLRLEEEMARRIGDVEAENSARQRADGLEDQKRIRNLEDEAKTLYETAEDQKSFVDSQMALERAARATKQAAADEDKARRKTDAKESQELTFGQLREEVLRYQGQTKAADDERKKNDRAKDDALRKDQKQKYVGDGFGADEADKLAGRDVLAQQAAREMEKLKAQGTGTIVASSMARIGGGGNVTGTDPVAARIDITNKLLEQIRDQRSGGSVGVE